MQVAANDDEQVQTPDDGLAELTRVVDRVLRRLGGSDGVWTLELQYVNGSFLRGFAKRGPIGADQFRQLARAGD